MHSPSLSTEFAEWLLTEDAAHFGPSARSAAQLMLLDALGCAVAARQAPGVALIAQQLKHWGGSAQARLWSDGTGLPAAHAALANSVAVHALDYDDVYMPGILHVSSALVPAVIAVAEETRAPGLDVLAALIAGTEAATRIGRVLRAHRRGDGFLPTSLVVGFGAVVAACRLKRLSPATCVAAMGLQYAQVGGNRQALLEATLAKRMQPGFAARSALHSVEMAACGLNGPEAIFEGPAGLFNLYGDGEIPSRDAFLGESSTFEIERVSYKRYPSCGACHNVQMAAERLHRKHAPRLADIAALHLFGCGPGGIVGYPFALGAHPQASAQFSAAWAASYALLRGPAVLEAYTDEAVAADHEVIELAQRAQFVPRPDGLPVEPERPAGYYPNSVHYHGVILKLADGREDMEIQAPCQTFAPGATSPDALIAKFQDCLLFGAGIPPEPAHELAQGILDLETQPDFRGFLDMFIHQTASA